MDKLTHSHESFEPELMVVPAGSFWMGSRSSEQENERPCHQVFLDEYWIGRYPVTNSQFVAFTEQSGYLTEYEIKNSDASWRSPRGNGTTIHGKEDHPVTRITWKDACAFCDWLSRVTRRHYCLPTEAQWEKAACGTDGRTYPWGESLPTRDLCNVKGLFGDTTPVGKFSLQGDSPYGCADMAGNVWEWCMDGYDESFYLVSPPRNPVGPDHFDFRMLRGGSWDARPARARCACRNRRNPGLGDSDFGFRVVMLIQ
jgi:formylglycine-generating enzyme required for sulfatase activity